MPAIAAALVTVLGLGGCAVGPDTGPQVVHGGGGGGEQPSSSAAPTGLPPIQAPRNDLDWTDCAPQTATRWGVDRPDGVTVQCADLTVPVNPYRPTGDTLTVGLTRAQVAATPDDAVPVVLTSGSDLPSSRTLLMLAAGPGRALLEQHPVVAIDRRGAPTSGELDCMTREERAAIRSNGLAGDADATQQQRIDRLAGSASSAAGGCTETLEPHQLDFGEAFAAADIEALRIRWGVDQLALAGVGEGSDVVLAYAGNFSGRAGRIILDTPTPFGANARDRAATRATGVQAALRTFAQQCSTAGSCPLGADGTATISDVLAKGRAGRLSGLSDTEALSAITTAVALAPDRPAATTETAAAIAAADRGDIGALTTLADRAAALRLTDGQLVARCNDVSGPVGQNEIPGLIDAWSKQNPLTGADTALSLMRCNAWASSTPVNPPSALPVDPLVLDGANDPINGGGGAQALGGLFIRAGTTPTTVSWGGLGYSVLARSACAADIVTQYLGDEPLGEPTDRGCPS
ncbi:alpha/beta hydrolase [Gordonia sp. Z-3]|uniref:Alpha/beta hydrolase n=2 Tax=Gordoniaceae TaxID=85026 RepID=A0ABS9DI46_9ACTN|nr:MULTISPECIES: alpha/beta hydrolase [Gordonia]MCF3937518.1 alpha/beta hydrolase [Gordonia tangerina]MED5800252.1 alpha/beta hydrolase [Gordonia sp. Z-3]